uniref:Ycf22 n=1 Tax=Gracilaria hainanensis TaxID=2871843 RepID=A0AAU7YPR6_9FLOR
MRGINIGYVHKIQVKYNYVLIKVNINMSSILIPKNSLVETTQTGLLNNTVVDITPLQNVKSQDIEKLNVFAKSCIQSLFLCHYDYIKGERGLNYDDLVRAATRISQRFDDPVLFKLVNIFLQNTIDISNEFIGFADSMVDIVNLIHDYLYQLIFNQL